MQLHEFEHIDAELLQALAQRLLDGLTQHLPGQQPCVIGISDGELGGNYGPTRQSITRAAHETFTAAVFRGRVDVVDA